MTATVMIVDDSGNTAELASAFARAGLRAIVVASSAELERSLERASVDAALLDGDRPELALARLDEIRAHRGGGRVLALVMGSAADAGADGPIADAYLEKSLDFSLTVARVTELLRARAQAELDETRAAFADELERKNRELEAFAYSVSHDLRAPLRSIDGFSQVLLEQYSELIDEQGQHYLSRVRAGARRMGSLIDDLLELSRVGRADLTPEPVDLSELARTVLGELAREEPDRAVSVYVQPGLSANADGRLLRVLLDNLLGNAWKFSAKVAGAEIGFDAEVRDGVSVYYVRDNGAGFDMKYADKLFRPFQRLHAVEDFAGTGIGLATVHRIVDRHGGRVWAEGEVGRGARFFFTLPSRRPTGSFIGGAPGESR